MVLSRCEKPDHRLVPKEGAGIVDRYDQNGRGRRAPPDAAYARTVLLERLEDALEELPEEQRDVFLAHEFEGRSFKQMAEETGLSINTLISRKRYAVLHLRERLQDIYDDLKEE